MELELLNTPSNNNDSLLGKKRHLKIGEISPLRLDYSPKFRKKLIIKRKKPKTKKPINKKPSK